MADALPTLICKSGHRANPIPGTRGGRPWCPKCGADMVAESDETAPAGRDPLRAVDSKAGARGR